MQTFQILIILQSKSLNHVCKLLQLLGTSSLRPSTGASSLDSTGGPLISHAIAPQLKIPRVTTMHHISFRLPVSQD